MGCGTGGADCPTCLGDVPPNAPVMQDLRFAMAMAQGPTFEDPFFGPLSVAQAVRDGIQRRGSEGDGDREMVAFMASMRREAATRAAAVALGSPPGLLFDEGPVQPGAPVPAPAPGPPSVPGKSKSAQTVAPVDENWMRFISKLPECPWTPGTPTGASSTTGKLICGVKTFDYPVETSFRGAPPSGTKNPNRPPGFYFDVVLEYLPDVPYACGCCVFRQWYTKSKGGGGYRRDRLGKKEYGGSRQDGSNKDWPDAPENEAKGTKRGTGPCRLEFHDVPREGGLIGPGFEWTLKYDYVGIVFDRCRNFLPVAARRMLMLRDVTYKQVGEDEDVLVVVEDAEGSPEVKKDQGPP